MLETLANFLSTKKGLMKNARLLRQMADHYGHISAEGLGAVNFRYDHYLNDFDEHIRPLHEAAQIKYALALDSRRWTHVQNRSVTPKHVNEWVAGGLAEIWNHGLDHLDRDTEESLREFILESKKELETAIPDAKIWGFLTPGVGKTHLGGFNNGCSLDRFTQTTAGRLLLGSHAVVNGVRFETKLRPIGSEQALGFDHFSIEKLAFPSIKKQIDHAIETRSALTLMMHPWVIHKERTITVDDLQKTIEYVRQNIDAGKLADLSLYESFVATQ